MNSRPGTRQQLSCCEGMNILSCDEIEIDLNALGDEDLYLEPLNTTLQYQGLVLMSSNSYHYSNGEVDFILTANVELGSVYGHAAFENGKSYVIEFCGENVHVLKELDVENLGADEGVDAIDENTNTSNYRVKRQAVSDTTTIVTYSIKIYYTPQFAATTADIQGFVEQVIQETNQGYINSKVPLRAKLHCIEQATLNDVSSSSTMLSQFSTMKGDSATLRGTADAAALLVNSFSACGIGYLNTIGSGKTLSVTAKGCALGYYSFGHELGHNIGLYHNREVTTNPYFSDGYGYLIPQGSASTGYRTILAYSATNHRQRVNYYSNPDVIYPTTGTATGIAGQADNARVITVQRFDLANVGDESSGCSGTTTPPPAASCSVQGKYQSLRHQYKGRTSQSNCESQCKSSNDCLAWVYYNRYSWCFFFVGKQFSYITYSNGPDPTQQSCNLYTPGSCISANSITYIRYLGSSSASSADACDDICRQQSGCTQWNYRSSGTCYKYQLYNRSYNGWTSGPRFC